VECDSFVVKVLSKDEHEVWWVVRALKTGSVGFVAASFLNHVAERVTLDTSSQVGKLHSHSSKFQAWLAPNVFCSRHSAYTRVYPKVSGLSP
jgi:hypothetical protein